MYYICISDKYSSINNMHTKGFSKTVIRSLDKLDSLQRRRLLAFIESMVSSRKEEKKQMLKFAGAFEKEELELIRNAIAEGCENIDHNEW